MRPSPIPGLEPFLCGAANRIKEAASLGKQERGFFGVFDAPQAFDIPLKSCNLWGRRHGFDQSLRSRLRGCMVAMHPPPVDATAISVPLSVAGLPAGSDIAGRVAPAHDAGP